MRFLRRRIRVAVKAALVLSLLASCVAPNISGPAQTDIPSHSPNAAIETAAPQDGLVLADLEYEGYPYVIINDNVPYFEEEDLSRTDPFETYSDLDDLGRCGVAYANICEELMPTEARGEIGMVKPTGWQTVRYDWVDGKYLYNRCHLIGFQLAGENANDKNLITGTRYLNVTGMLPFENEIADYVHKTTNHVLYRVTPIFNGSDLVAKGVLMEAYSVEDEGYGVCFNVFCFNAQPGVRIDYATGDNWADDTVQAADKTVDIGTTGNSVSDEDLYTDQVAQEYVLNTRSKKFHLPGCTYADSIADYNRQDYYGVRGVLIDQGYTPCGSCNP